MEADAIRPVDELDFSNPSVRIIYGYIEIRQTY